MRIKEIVDNQIRQWGLVSQEEHSESRTYLMSLDGEDRHLADEVEAEFRLEFENRYPDCVVESKNWASGFHQKSVQIVVKKQS